MVSKHPPLWRSLVFRLVVMILLTTSLGIVIVATIIHQTTRANFDAERVNWQVLQEQDPSAIQSAVLSRYTLEKMQGACDFLSGINQQELTTDIVLLDNNQMVHCATKPYFRYAQVVFHDSGAIRLFSESAQVMAFDLEVSESLPLKNSNGDIEGWAMTVEAQPLLIEGDEFAWRVWQQSGIWIGITLVILTLVAAFSVRRAIRPIFKITDAAGKLKKGTIPGPLSESANATELAALLETFNEATKTLSETQQLRERLVSDIAHELRTPVTNIKGQLEALQLRLVANNDDFHETVADEILLLQQLIADFQDLARSDAGQLKLNVASYPLLELLESCLLPQKHCPTNGNSPCSLTVSISVDESLYVNVDELRFRQVILNLLENAKKAKPENLHIEVIAKQTKTSVELSFVDNGPGIPESDIPHIFERFYRADKSRNRNTGGSGLGLAIVSGLITAMQGNIRYEERDNCGGCFVLTFQAGEQAMVQD